MTKHTLLLIALFSSACSGDASEATVTKVDVEDPATVLDPDGDGAAQGTVEGEVAAISLELEEPLPEIDFRVDGTDDAAVMDVASALSLTVSSPRSGISVSLGDGELVAGPPSKAGEWSIELSDDRLVFDVSWFNESKGGLTMKTGEEYDLVYSLGDNCCIKSFDDTAMNFTVD
ncbi:MAG: hypothetical protein IAG13_06235 [Deltaproteobacteria bacterium]|nr:hypothetical protein [Nannocystaceae bacterium]